MTPWTRWRRRAAAGARHFPLVLSVLQRHAARSRVTVQGTRRARAASRAADTGSRAVWEATSSGQLNSVAPEGTISGAVCSANLCQRTRAWRSSRPLNGQAHGQQDGHLPSRGDAGQDGYQSDTNSRWNLKLELALSAASCPAANHSAQRVQVRAQSISHPLHSALGRGKGRGRGREREGESALHDTHCRWLAVRGRRRRLFALS